MYVPLWQLAIMAVVFGAAAGGWAGWAVSRRSVRRNAVSSVALILPILLFSKGPVVLLAVYLGVWVASFLVSQLPLRTRLAVRHEGVDASHVESSPQP